MLWATNSTPQVLDEDALVAFDTVLCNTNSNAKLNEEDKDTVSITGTGWYVASLRGTLANTSSTAAILSGVRLLANGVEVIGGDIHFNIPASGSIPFAISVPVHVIPAETGTATISWQMTDSATINNATMSLERKI